MSLQTPLDMALDGLHADIRALGAPVKRGPGRPAADPAVKARAKYLADDLALGREVLEMTALTDLQRDWIRQVRNGGEYQLYLAFRGSFKSTTFGTLLPVSEILHDPNTSFAFFDSTIENSRNKIAAIRQHFAFNEHFRGLFGEYGGMGDRARAENKSEYICPHRTAPQLDPTLRAAALGRGMTGRHPAYLLSDDLWNIESKFSEIKRKRDIDHFREFLNLKKRVKGKRSQMILWGTRWHSQDLAWYIMEHHPEFEVHQYPGADADDRALYPDLLSQDFIDAWKANEYADYMMQCRLFPTQASTGYFPYDAIMDWAFTHQDDPGRVDGVYLYADPAWGGGPKHCYSSVVGSFTRGGVTYIDHVAAKQTNLDEFVNLYVKGIQWARKVSPGAVFGCESNSAQQAIVKLIEQRCEALGIRNVAIRRIENMGKKEERIESIATPLIAGKVRLRRDIVTVCPQFGEQVFGYPDADKRDVADTLAGNIRLAQRSTGRALTGHRPSINGTQSGNSRAGTGGV